MHRGRFAVIALVAAVVCGAAAAIVLPSIGDASPRPAAAGVTTSTSSATSPATSDLPATTAASSNDGTTYIATAKVATVRVFDEPDMTEPSHRFENPWFVNGNPSAAVPLVFLVQQRRDGWVQVLLPVRPNASTGWVHETDVTLAPTPYRVVVELGAHRLRAYKGDEVIVDDTVAVGAAATPTPQGTYFIRALLQSPTPNSAYGPFAYGLSGYSEALQSFDGGDAEIGIHGNNDPTALGHDVTHGCVRMSNAAITALVPVLPLGTPVAIVP